MPAFRTHLSSTSRTLAVQRGTLVAIGLAAVLHIVGCTVEIVDSPSSTGGSGGSSVAGAGGGAAPSDRAGSAGSDGANRATVQAPRGDGGTDR
jgi:hypothetical protein